jgi:hypothetical protein
MTFKDYLTEKAPLQASSDSGAKLIRIHRTVPIPDAVILVCLWFSGHFMGSPEGFEAKMLADALKAIGKEYQSTAPAKLYRATHLRLPSPKYKKDDILKMTNVSTGPKRLQSWATKRDGAEWFYSHFVSDQNHGNIRQKGKAWVILSTDASQVQTYTSWEDLIQFLSDVYQNYDKWDSQMDFPRDKFYHIIDNYNGSEMQKNWEVICHTPPQIKADILDIKLL